MIALSSLHVEDFFFPSSGRIFPKAKALNINTYIHACMGTKTISIGEDAYLLLVSQKGAKESFTDVIKRVVQPKTLLDLAGVLTGKEATTLERDIRARRKEMNARIHSISKEFSS